MCGLGIKFTLNSNSNIQKRKLLTPFIEETERWMDTHFPIQNTFFCLHTKCSFYIKLLISIQYGVKKSSS